MRTAIFNRVFWIAAVTLGVIPLSLLLALPPEPGPQGASEARAADIVGPEGGEQSCANCHALEAEAWKQTRHFSTYIDRHQSDRAKEILTLMGARSMKREPFCRDCHYTSALVNDRVRPGWGVSCESCHAPGRAWNDTHNKEGGAADGRTLKWGEGKGETAAAREARLGTAVAQGMIHSEMIYDIAANCFGCHTVPNENLVNLGTHKAGSDFDLLAWSQGEIRHNFLSSPGAPDQPTNRPASAGRKRTLYVVGAMVDLEFSLRNLAQVSEKGGPFHKAMVDRVNRARMKVDAILAAAELGDLSAAVDTIPNPVDESTAVSADLADRLESATRAFARTSPDLAASDSQLPSEFRGTAYQQ